MNALDWALFVLVVEVIIVLAPLMREERRIERKNGAASCRR